MHIENVKLTYLLASTNVAVNDYPQLSSIKQSWGTKVGPCFHVFVFMSLTESCI